MKTKYILLNILMISIIFCSCEKAKTNLHKFHGVWEVINVDDIDNSSGALISSHRDAGYFLLYDQEFVDAENDCFYDSDSTYTPYLMTALGSGGYCFWFINTSGQIEFYNGTSTYQATIDRKGYNAMNWTFINGSNKEILYLERADV
ncbi:MAG: hypothetical protein V1904_14420 [Bacteroidota bacterium]